MKNRKIALLIIALVFITASFICGIVNYAVSQSFSWSLIASGGMALGLVFLSPMLLFKKDNILWSITFTTIALIPYLLLIESFVGGNWVSDIALPIMIMSYVYLLINLSIYLKTKINKLLSTIVAIFLILPLNTGIQWVIGEDIMNANSIINGLIILMTAIILIVVYFIKKVAKEEK